MKIGIIIPTRNRSKFLKFSIEHLIKKQTLKPDYIEVVNRESIYPNQKDVTWRYKEGVKKLGKKEVDLIIFWEDDDWYHERYLEWMADNWIVSGKPDMIGINRTIYYHIGEKLYRNLNHGGRSSAMSMGLTLNARFKWCEDTHPYLDYYLWTRQRNNMSNALFTFDFNKPMCIGIKHGIGMVGGGGHKRFKIYKEVDRNMKHLEMLVGDDKKSFEFYKKINNELRSS